MRQCMYIGYRADRTIRFDTVFFCSRCHGTARDTRYARRVAFLSSFDIAWQMVYPPRLPVYRFSRSCIPVELSSNPLESPRQLYVAINSLNLMLVYLAFACDTSSS